jgi:hypothetical protein
MNQKSIQMYVVFLVLMLFFANTFCNESKNGIIRFSELKAVYNSKPVKFQIKNVSDGDLYYYCSVEKKIKGRWREIVASIDDDSVNKAVQLHNIKAYEKKILLWDHKINADISGNQQIFRFKITIFDSIKVELKEKYFSPEFVIHN